MRSTGSGFPVLEAFELSNGLIAVRLDAENGVFDVRDGDGDTVVSDAAFGVVLTDGSPLSSRGLSMRLVSANQPVDDALGGGLGMTAEVDIRNGLSLSVTVTLYDAAPSVVIDGDLHNETPEPARVARFDVLQGARLNLASSGETWRFYKQGWQSWSPTLLLECSGEDVPMAPSVIAPSTQPEARAGRFVSDLMTAVFSPECRRSIVAGFVTTGDQMSQIWLDREAQTLAAWSYADGITVPPGGKMRSERLLIEPTRAPLEAMERYGDALGRAMHGRPSADIATGWCSWYQYGQGVSEEAVLANLEALSRKGRYALAVEYVQIDDGWQADIGDWLDVNGKFPHGLRWLVERIHEAGFKAGLWLAPFLIGKKSRLWKEHPEWAVQYKPGKPFIAMQNWGQDCYALDLTRPEVIEWLKFVVRTVCEEWGFDYVKIDFIYAGAVDGMRCDAEVTRAQAYRRGLEAIREAVGERFVLGCGNPMGASVGLVDGARISPDVAPFWKPPGRPEDPERYRMSEPSALNAIRNTMTRWWMHGRLWQNDPDCLLVRSEETALTEDEVRTLATVIAMSGGMVADSDDLARLSDERRQWLSMLLPPSGKAARPIDLFESDVSRLLELDCGSHRMLAVFNWGDAIARIEAPLPAGRFEVFDAWSHDYLGVREGCLPFELPPHGCRLIALRLSATEENEASRELPKLFRGPGFERERS